VAPGAPSPVVLVPTAEGTIRYTVADLAGLRALRAELSSQLSSVTGRRRELSRALSGKDGADRAGIEQRITLLDERILQLEREIAATGQQVATATRQLRTGERRPERPANALDRGDVVGIALAFIFAVLMPLSIAIARGVWRRSSQPALASRRDAEGEARLMRVEQALEAVAIEVERISEGQRFVTRLLTEARPAAVAAPAPARVPAGQVATPR
jgi:hypothetical protein